MNYIVSVTEVLQSVQHEKRSYLFFGRLEPTVPSALKDIDRTFTVAADSVRCAVVYNRSHTVRSLKQFLQLIFFNLISKWILGCLSSVMLQTRLHRVQSSFRGSSAAVPELFFVFWRLKPFENMDDQHHVPSLNAVRGVVHPQTSKKMKNRQNT